jgi:uncharacterized membrane protein
MWRGILAGAALLAGLCLSGGVANADFRSCNTTGETIWMAFGYWDEDRGWISEGWHPLDDQYCYINVVGELDNRYYYVYAEDEAIDKVWEASDEEDGGLFCIMDDDFEIEVDDYTENDVVECGEDMFLIRFVEIDVDGEQDHTFYFTAEDAKIPEDGPPPKGGK